MNVDICLSHGGKQPRRFRGPTTGSGLVSVNTFQGRARTRGCAVAREERTDAVELMDVAGTSGRASAPWRPASIM